MHRLERRAQDAPFLMDALEDYTANKKDQQANLDELQNRLNQRVTHHSKKTFTLWPLISVAATILVFIAVGAWWFLLYRPAAQISSKTMVQSAKITVMPDKNLSPLAPRQSLRSPLPQRYEVRRPANGNRDMAALPTKNVKSISGRANEQLAAMGVPAAKSNTENIILKAPTTQADTGELAYKNSVPKIDTSSRLAEVSIVGHHSQAKKDLTGSLTAVGPINQPLKSRVAGVEVNFPERRTRARIINGQVISGEDNLPVPGASISVAASKMGVTTDPQGKFSIAASPQDKLNIGYIGYESQAVDAKSDSLSIALKPAMPCLTR